MQKFLAVSVIVFFILIIFPSKIYASVEVLVSSFPAEVIAGKEFSVSFSASGVDPLAGYYAKALGGENFTQVDTKNNGSWLQQNSAWAGMPQFSANSESSVSGVFGARFDPAAPEGSKQFKIRIHGIDTDSNYDSDTVNINVLAPSPSPTPTPKPTSSPAPTNSPTPTGIPTPTPSKTFTPRPTPKNTPQNPGGVTDQTPGADVLGLRESLNSTEAPVPDGSERKFPFLAIIFVGLGLALTGAAGYLAYRKQKEDSPDIVIRSK